MEVAWGVVEYLGGLRGPVRILLGFAAVGKFLHNDAAGHDLAN